ncbi:hypothetical protein, partial [Salmonella sp. s54836]|uniref:hypothetical protein n=1 Tax=Salmonella sp. s54836 TaxID=3159673 RepID=UPI00397FA500
MFGHDLLEQFRRTGETLFLLDRTGRLIPLDRDDQLLSLSDAERMGLLGREQLLDREDSYISDLIEDRLYKR